MPLKIKKWIALLLALMLALTLTVPALAAEEASGEPSGPSSGELFAAPEFPDDAKIVSATTYSVYTKNPDSMQDAVIQATLYWDLTNDKVFDIRFVEPMLPWDDNSQDMGWACVKDETLLETLGEADALLEFKDGIEYAKYLQIGDIVWTAELGSHPAAEEAVDYVAEIDGKETTLNDYVRTPEGAEWYVESSKRPALFLTDDTPSPEHDPNEPPSAPPENVACVYTITYKENNGHGVFFWLSDITFPGNIQAIKDFVTENGFDYDYYADGGITKNDDGFWQTPDAVSGATLDETPTYLDILKTLYEEIQAGNYVEEN